MTQFILIDGEAAAAVHALDRGLQFGDGLFETMAVTGGRVRLLSRHLERLLADCQRLAIEAPPLDTLQTELSSAAQKLSQGVIKLIITRGSAARGYRLPLHPLSRRILIASGWPSMPAQLRLTVCKTRLAAGGSLAGIKHLNRLEQVMACAEWQQDDNVDEGLMLDPDNNVIETTSANVFIVTDGKVTTPSLQRCGVSGVMRALVIELIKESGRPCQTASIGLDDVLAADEVFLTNSLGGIRPVLSLQDRTWSGGPVTQSLCELLESRWDVASGRERL